MNSQELKIIVSEVIDRWQTSIRQAIINEIVKEAEKYIEQEVERRLKDREL